MDERDRVMDGQEGVMDGQEGGIRVFKIPGMDGGV